MKDKKRELIIGDLLVVCDGRKGFSIYGKGDGRLLCWMNQKGEEALATWINQKPYSEKDVPDGGQIPHSNLPPAGEKGD